MADFELVMPKMGESIMEATILKWLKKEGDLVAEDETLLEIATDKVDSEIPSPVSGTVQELRYGEDDVVKVGDVIAVITTDKMIEKQTSNGSSISGEELPDVMVSAPVPPITKPEAPVKEEKVVKPLESMSGRFYSPLVRNIAETEGISQEELDLVPGTGLDNRVTKHDILAYVANRIPAATTPAEETPPAFLQTPTSIRAGSGDEIIEMDRMRKLIAKHMVESKRTSPHVTSFVEADVTNLFDWRQRNKDRFADKYATKLTFTPIFIQAVCQAIHDFPNINASLQGDHIVIKKGIHIGMATALPSGNLIVPVIRDANTLNLAGLAKQVNSLALQARENRLDPAAIQGGTFTLTNVGTFGNVMGTPIINQPQVAILATGAIRKKPAVVETAYGDLIAVRQMMFLSLSYDHRVVDGFLGGSFLRRVADILEGFELEDVS